MVSIGNSLPRSTSHHGSSVPSSGVGLAAVAVSCRWCCRRWPGWRRRRGRCSSGWPCRCRAMFLPSLIHLHLGQGQVRCRPGNSIRTYRPAVSLPLPTSAASSFGRPCKSGSTLGYRLARKPGRGSAASPRPGPASGADRLRRQGPGLVDAAIGGDQGHEAQLARHRRFGRRGQLFQVGAGRRPARPACSARSAAGPGRTATLSSWLLLLVILAANGVEQDAHLALVFRASPGR